MLVERSASSHLAELARRFPVIFVTGARQVGKTTLLTHHLPNAQYLTLDDPAVAEHAEGAPASFIDSLRTPSILDEVQYAPSIFRNLKLAADRSKKPGTFYLTGSQRFPLMRGVSESLAGRVGLLHLPTLTHAELVNAGRGADLFESVFTGGFPALHADIGQEPRFWFPNYVATYLERDVRNVISVHNLRDFHRFLRAVALRSAQLLNYADLARDIGLAPNTVRAWLSVLEASGLVVLVEPWATNRTVRLIKTPKLYFTDTGLLSYLVGIESAAQLRGSALLGAIWETWAFAQLHAWFLNRGQSRPAIHFFRTKEGQEVDFVIEAPSGLIGIECKARETVGGHDARGLDALAAMLGPKQKLERVFFVTVERARRSPTHRMENGLGLSEWLSA
jgi:uncharacterized protein